MLGTALTGWSEAQQPPPRFPRDFSNDVVSGSLASPHARSLRAPFIPGLHEQMERTFPNIVRAAGMIFSATVQRIERHPASAGQSVETVAITLHVERAIRGAMPGEDLTISQWIGLWSGGQRYRVGERVLLFLYPRSKLGLTSCVGGSLGRFNIDAWGRVALSARQLSAFQTDPVLRGKSRVAFGDFALAVRHADEEE